jgi:hypothetical protein
LVTAAAVQMAAADVAGGELAVKFTEAINQLVIY